MSAEKAASNAVPGVGRFKSSARPGAQEKGKIFYGAWSQQGQELRVRELTAAPWEQGFVESGAEHDANELVMLPPVQPGKIVARSAAGAFELIAPNALAPHRSMMTVAYVEHETRVYAGLALVISQKVRRLRAGQEQEARAAVAGLALAQSVEDLDWRRRDGGNGTRGRSFETYLPLGPLIHSLEEVYGAENSLELRRNGDCSQRLSVAELLPDLAAMLAEVTDCFTLLPGDVVLVRAETEAPLTQPGDHLEVRLCGARSLTTNVGMRGSA